MLESSKADVNQHRSWLFLNPVTELSLDIAELSLEGLHSFFNEMETHQRQGRYLAGYLGYEAGYPLLGVAEPPRLPYPVACFDVYAEALIFDHLTGEVRGKLELLPDKVPDIALPHALLQPQLELNYEDFSTRFRRVQDYLAAGDSYQINLTDAYRLSLAAEDSLARYRQLKQSQPVSYGAYLKLASLHILSLSPELFFETDGGVITTKPMKGTWRRGCTLEEDEHLAAQLANDAKCRAENVMIVDLLRNDLGKVCEVGTITVPRLFEVERFASLLQMTSTVKGRLRADTSLYELFAGLFPCGSVTGAPKRRSMEIIRELETKPRGIYTGSIGFIAPDGEMAFNVAIRTLVIETSPRAETRGEMKGVMGIGSGLVVDSKVDEEYVEWQLKARFLTQGSDGQGGEAFELFETLRWERSYLFLEEHLARLARSAAYFNMPLEPTEARKRLLEPSQAFNPQQIYRVKLKLAKDGGLTVTHQAFEERAHDHLAVALADKRIDPADPFLYHKTTCRMRYDQAMDEAASRGLADLIFVNTRDEVTEGAISNVVVVLGGKSYTPPLRCGLLPGIYRQHLLETGQVAERIVSVNDLMSADALYLCNALRGLRRVTLELSQEAGKGVARAPK